jgi:hypothetical protein
LRVTSRGLGDVYKRQTGVVLAAGVGVDPVILPPPYPLPGDCFFIVGYIVFLTELPTEDAAFPTEDAAFPNGSLNDLVDPVEDPAYSSNCSCSEAAMCSYSAAISFNLLKERVILLILVYFLLFIKKEDPKTPSIKVL